MRQSNSWLLQRLKSSWWIERSLEVLFWCVRWLMMFQQSINFKVFIVSFLFTDQPVVASFPHFYTRPGKFLDKLEGIHPNASKHRSYTIIEPTLGVPLNQRAVSQSSVVTKDLRGFKSDIAKFSNMVIPMFWVEYVRQPMPLFEGSQIFTFFRSISKKSRLW